MKKFKVYDMYDPFDRDVIGYADTMEEVIRLAKSWWRDTDGECYPMYAELNPETGKYKFSQRKRITGF